MRRSTAHAVRAFGVTASLLLAAPSLAAITGGGVNDSTTGGVFEQLTPPPTEAGPNAYDSPNLIAFDEQQDVLIVERFPLGGNRTLGVGSVVSSHYVAFDPATPGMLSGFVGFDEPIVAIIRTGGGLDATNTLFGADGVAYSTGPAIGLDSMATDQALVPSANPTRLFFSAGANSPGDHIRVLTGVVVPEPTGLVAAMLATALTGFCRHPPAVN